MNPLFAIILVGQIGVTSPDATPTIIQKGVEAELKDLGMNVVDYQRTEILREQAMQLSGAIRQSVRTGQLIGATNILSVSSMVNDSNWTLCLKLINVESGAIEALKCETVKGDVDDALTGARYLTANLFGKSNPVREVVTVEKVKTIRVEQPIQNIVFHEVPQRQKVFYPCHQCGGKGKLSCATFGSIPQDCPSCSEIYRYEGPETGYKPLTGQWR